MANFISSCDVLGQEISLKLNRREKSKTLIGGIITIIIYCLLFAMLCYTSLDLFYKSNPDVSLEIQSLEVRPNLTLNNETFPLAFMLQDNYMNNYNLPNYFTMEAIKYTIVNTAENPYTEIEKYEITLCEPSKFPFMDPETFYNSGLGKYFCIRDQNITIGGYYDSVYTVYLGLNLKLCQNSTNSNITCAPLEEIQNFLQKQVLYWTIFFQNTIFNTNNYTHPTSRYLLTMYKSVQAKASKYYNIFLKPQTLENDDGFITKQLSYSSIITYESNEDDTADIDSEGLLCTINFYSSNISEIIHRKYAKIQIIISNLFGLANAFIFVFKFVCSKFSIINKNQIILNKLYDFDLGENEKLDYMNDKSEVCKYKKKEFSRKIIKNVSINNDNCNESNLVFNFNKNSDILAKKQIHNNNSSFLNVSNLNTIYRNTIIEKGIKINKSGKEKYETLSFTNWEILKMSVFSCCVGEKLKKKTLLYNKSSEILDDFLDVSSLISKMEEYEKLKYAMLNFEQITLLNNLSKPLCTLDEEKEKNTIMNALKNTNKSDDFIKNQVDSIKDKIRFNDRYITDLDRKLYLLLREDLK